ncbi:MAG: hypothetical protein IJ068_01135 [Bacilli bacterium]|nr:hypothetical protein [Bacilli bacterium]
MKKKILFLVTILLLSCACSNNYLKNINIKNLNQMLDNKESFVLYLTDNDEGKVLKNNLKDVANDNKINIYYLNTVKLNDDELESLKKIFTFDETNIVLFIKDGKEETVLSRISDIYISNSELEQEIKTQGYIEKEN